MVGTKHVFWQALLSAVLIFGIGLLLGIWLEETRTTKIENLLLQSEINVLDSQLIGKVNENFDIECKIAKEKIFQLADEIYEEARLLEQYDASSQLTEILQTVHKRYDLLRIMLWAEGNKVKEKCKGDFHIIAYFYQYNEPPINIKSQQVAFARYLEDIKEQQGENLLLLPIAGDLGLSSVEVVKKNFKITRYPAIILDEKTRIDNLEDLKKINILLSSNQSR